MQYNLDVSDLHRKAQALVTFHQQFVQYFKTQTRTVAAHALDYLKGQLLCPSRRNMNHMAKQVTTKNAQALSHFVSQSPWKDEPVIDAIGKGVVERMAGQAGTLPDPALILDESGIPKQGDQSVGVARQYCGALGKVDTCQVGVFLAYSTPTHASLIDRRLYVPEAWVNDLERCQHAGIPETERVFRTKAQLGLEMILKAQARGLPFDFVGMDAHYGEQPWLLTALEQAPKPIIYVADIPCDTQVYLDYPHVGVPPRKGSRGKSPTKPRVLHGEAVEVQALVSSGRVALRSLKIRETQRGELWVHTGALRVWRIEEKLPTAQSVWLIVRREMDGSDVKFSFSNAPASTSLETLVERQSRRYFVERAVQDGKELAGLDEYQVTGWRGWHHHMTLVLLAMLFLLEVKHDLVEKAPLLSLQDTVEILKVVMPRKTLSVQDAVELIRQKHLNRFRSRNSRLKKQRVWLKASGFLM